MDWLANNWEAVVTVALAVAGGGLLAWRRFGLDKRKSEATTENTLSLTVANLGVEVARLTTALDDERQKRRELEDKVEALIDSEKALQATIRNWRAGIKRLVKQVRDLGGDPVWTPDE